MTANTTTSHHLRPFLRHAGLHLALLAALCGAPLPEALAAKAVASVTEAKASAQSAPRIALVLGNSKYLKAPLANPANDAKAVAEKLTTAGFRVTMKLDANRQEMQDAIRDFAQKLKESKGVGLFYYAGHALQLNWHNFLVPVDARIKQQADIAAQTVDVSLLLEGLDRARNPVNVVILDACRNNPFGADFRTDDKGLSQLDAPPGTLLAFATAPGNTAEDGEGSNGLYTSHLLKEMTVPGAKAEDVFKRVRLAVRRASEGAQIPWESTSLEDDFFFGPRPAGTTTSDAEILRRFQDELATWMHIKDATEPAPLEAYLRATPSGKFAEMAQFRLDQILAQRGEKPVQPLVAALPASRAGGAEPACAPGTAAPAGNARIDTAYRVGDRYSYRRVDLRSGNETGRSTDTVSSVTSEDVFFNDGSKSTDLFGNQNRAPDGRRWTPYQFFIADYQVGKKWPAQFVVTDASGREINIAFELHVAARERITVPAGTFDAFRIEARGRNLSAGTTLERRYWVAPQTVRGFVAQENVTRKGDAVIDAERIELVEFAQSGTINSAPKTQGAANTPKPAPAPRPAAASGGWGGY